MKDKKINFVLDGEIDKLIAVDKIKLGFGNKGEVINEILKQHYKENKDIKIKYGEDK